jgi:hypothetical protein
MAWRHRVAGVVLILAAVAAPSRAQVPAGSELGVNTYTTGHQLQPAVAAAANGDFIVVWSDYGQDGGNGVFAQRYDAAGARRGGEFRVNTYTTGSQDRAKVASDPRGNVVVVWSSLGQDGSSGGVFAQRLDAAGAPRGGEFRVNGYTTGNQQWPAVATDAAGNFVVAWSGPDSGGYLDVFAQRYDASGAPLGAEFRVNTYSTSIQFLPSVSVAAGGDFVVAWHSLQQDLSGNGVYAQRYDATGAPRGGEFRVNTHTTNHQSRAVVAMDAGGGFVAAWDSNYQDGDRAGVFAQRYDAAGAPQGTEFRVNTYTTETQSVPRLVGEASGRFLLVWNSNGQDGSASGVYAQRYAATGAPRGSEFRVNTFTLDQQTGPVAAVDAVGNFVVAWDGNLQDGSGFGVLAQRFGGLHAQALAADPASAGGSDGNGVFEPGETAPVRPSWRNSVGSTQNVGGVASAFTGPAGAVYTIADGAAAYALPDGTATECADCYALGVSNPSPRPALHWDAAWVETLQPEPVHGQEKTWNVHVGDSFTDVPRGNPFYRFVETLLHKGVTGGCGASTYCPASSTTREQMAVFVLIAREGAGYAPVACAPPNTFGDVPETSPFCRFIEELSNRGVVGGCGGGNYCPGEAVTREQMAVFVLRTLDPALDPPACAPPNMFDDVPETSLFCRWIEELARRGVVSGCGGGNYCPADPVTREQMGVFLGVSFGLTLYGP